MVMSFLEKLVWQSVRTFTHVEIYSDADINHPTQTRDLDNTTPKKSQTIDAGDRRITVTDQGRRGALIEVDQPRPDGNGRISSRSTVKNSTSALAIPPGVIPVSSNSPAAKDFTYIAITHAPSKQLFRRPNIPQIFRRLGFGR